MRWHILASGFVLLCMLAAAEGQDAPFQERFLDFSASPKPKSIKTEKIIVPPKTATASELANSPQQPVKEGPPLAVREQKQGRREIVDQIRQEVKKIHELKEKLRNAR